MAAILPLLGLVVAAWVPSVDRNPLEPDLIQLQRVIRLDSLLAAATLLVVAQRSVLRRVVTATGAVVAIVILSLAGTQFASLLPLGQG